jgi:hypothetical protein
VKHPDTFISVDFGKLGKGLIVQFLRGVLAKQVAFAERGDRFVDEREEADHGRNQARRVLVFMESQSFDQRLYRAFGSA